MRVPLARRAVRTASALCAVASLTLGGALAASAGPVPAGPEPAGIQTVRGEYLRIVVDAVDGDHQDRHYLVLEEGERILLDVDASQVEDLRSGQEVAVTGTPEAATATDASALDVQTVVALDAAPPLTPVSGAKKVAVVLVQRAGAPHTRATVASLRPVYFTGTRSAKAFFEQNSWNALTITGRDNANGDFYDTVTIPADTGCFAEMDAARTAAAAAGIDFTGYDYVQFFAAGSPEGVAACGYNGYAELPGRFSFIRDEDDSPLGTIVHEWGHNFGVQHSGALICRDAANQYHPLEGSGLTCFDGGANDPFSIMGQTLFERQFNGTNKVQLGWIPQANVTTVTGAGTYSISPSTIQTTSPQVLRVPYGTDGWVYEIEYRQPAGEFEKPTSGPLTHNVSELVSTETNGVHVRRVDPSGHTVQIVTDLPNGGVGFDWSEAPLQAGESITDPLAGVTFQTVAASGSGALVSVTPSYTSVYPSVYLRGTHNAWGTTTPMTLVANNTWSSTVTFGATSTERFKFDVYGNWATNFGDNAPRNGVADANGADIPVTQGAGQYTVTFNDSTKAYTVVKQGVNQPPVARAGADVTVPAGTVVTFDGYASSDPDGSIVSYAWAGPGFTRTGPTTFYRFDDPGTFTVTLTVTDDQGATASDSLVVTVTGGSFTSVYPSVYLRGTHNAWGTTTPMTLVGNNTWRATATFGATSTERFKFDVYGNWATNFGDNAPRNGVGDANGADIPITQGAGQYTITFNDSTKAYTVVKQ